MTVLRSRGLLAAMLSLGATVPLAAHPGVGIVMDSRGNVYYTDLIHVWRQAPDGRTAIAVRNVHTHELYMDRGDTLYGEHLWYESHTRTWRHRIWRLTPSGAVEDIVPTRTGFRDDYDDFHFVRDGMGVAYWADHDGRRATIRKRSVTGDQRLVVETPFRRVGWLGVSDAGTIYFVADGNLCRLDARGGLAVVAHDIVERTAAPWHVRAVGWVLKTLGLHDGPDHDVAGVWADRADHVYVAEPGGRVVKRISPRGEVQVVARSGEGWAATGGLVATDGTLVLLEFGGGGARVRRLPAAVPGP